MKKTGINKNVIMLCECAVMVALATVLSLIKIEFPYGGSITICSMLPILIIGYRYKPLVGCLTGVVYGLIQMLFGMSNFAYATSWQAALMILFFDYLIAFGVIGLGGVFRGIKKSGSRTCFGRIACKRVEIFVPFLKRYYRVGRFCGRYACLVVFAYIQRFVYAPRIWHFDCSGYCFGTFG